MEVYDFVQEQGIKVLTQAIAACAATIERHKGKLTIKEPPRAVSFRIPFHCHLNISLFWLFHCLER